MSLATTVYDKTKLLLVEPLGRTLNVGSVGYFSDGSWIELATTRKMFNLALKPLPTDAHPNSFDGSGGDGFSFDVKADGVVSTLVPDAADAKLRAEISFGSESGFVFSLKDQVVETAGDLAPLIAGIRWAYHLRDTLPEGQRWERKYAVIVGVGSAKSAIAVASTSNNAAIVVQGSGNLPTPSSPAELDARMKITHTHENTDKLWLGPATGYAVQALQLDPSIFKKWDREDAGYRRNIGGEEYVAPREGIVLSLEPPTSFIDWVNYKGLESTVELPASFLGPEDLTDEDR
ncbi:MAG: hypothetical protein ACJ74U_09020 [Jatrophihabitantaceae bacterium]